MHVCVLGARFFPEYLSRERVTGLDNRAQQVRTTALSAMKVLHRQQLLDSVHPRLALPAPSASATEAATAASTTGVAPLYPDTKESLQPVVPTRPTGPVKSFKGCAHLCEALACRLPPERFWENSRGGGGQGKRDTPVERGPRKALTRG